MPVVTIVYFIWILVSLNRGKYMKSILFLIPTLGHGGAEKVLVNLVNHIDTAEFSVTVQTLFDEGINKQFLSENIRYKTFLKHQFRGNSWLMMLFSPEALYKLIVKERYDIVVSFLEGPTARIVTGCPFADTIKISWFHTAPQLIKDFKVGFLTKQLAIDAYSKLDKVVCVSKEVKEALIGFSNCFVKNTCILYNVNDSEQIRLRSLEQPEDLRRDKKAVKIMSVGKLDPVKGYDRLLRVHKRLLDEGVSHVLYIIGTGTQKDVLQQYIDDNDLSHSAFLMGLKDNPYKYLAHADLFVCSSIREGFSTAVTEALILGVPVVSTLCSGAKELLGENDEFGLVVENSEDGIYSGIKQMLNSTELRSYFSRQARIRGSKFRTEETVAAVEEMFRNV